MFYSYKQLDCALGSEVISEISPNRPELRPDTYLPSPYYSNEIPANGPRRSARLHGNAAENAAAQQIGDNFIY